MRRIIALAAAAAFLQATAHGERLDGAIFARTLRGGAQIIPEGAAPIAPGECALARGAVVKCPEGAFASFAMSNGAAVFVRGPASLKIEKFAQDAPPLKKFSREEESAPSDVEITLESGEMTMSRSPVRPSSTFKVKTRFGTFAAAENNMRVSAGGDSASAWASGCAINFFPAGAESPEYVGIGYSVTASDAGMEKRAVAKDEERELKKLFAAVEDAWKTSEVSHFENGAASGRRTLFKSFWIRDPAREANPED